MFSANREENGPTERHEREAHARRQVAELAKSKLDSQRARKVIDEALHPERSGRSGQFTRSPARPR
jgi:hypothetical protein